jgi:hypothetical protein
MFPPAPFNPLSGRLEDLQLEDFCAMDGWFIDSVPNLL